MKSSSSDIITSPSNPLIKRLRSLDRKKGRSDSGLFLAEGARLVAQGLEQGWQADVVLVNSEAADRSYIQDIKTRTESAGGKVIEVPKKILTKVSRKDNPQAVIAAFRQRHRDISDLDVASTGIWIALYEIRDPGNLGTIIRTADCAHVAGVLLIGTCCDPYSVEAVRASMGSVFDVPFATSDLQEFLEWTKSTDCSLIAASVNGTHRHDENIYGERAVLLMGNEQAGLPETVETECDTLALIPMRGGADSLNLAQATAIMTYEAWRQRGFQ